MPRTRPPYPPEVREQIVELVRAGRTPEELAEEYEPSAPTIRNWVAQADRNQGVRADGLTSAEKEEPRRLRRENKVLRQEKEILKKAAAGLARESNSSVQIVSSYVSPEHVWHHGLTASQKMLNGTLLLGKL